MSPSSPVWNTNPSPSLQRELLGDVAVGHQIALVNQPAGADPRVVGIARQLDAPDGGDRPPEHAARLLEPLLPEPNVARVLELELRLAVLDRQHRPAAAHDDRLVVDRPLGRTVDLEPFVRDALRLRQLFVLVEQAVVVGAKQLDLLFRCPHSNLLPLPAAAMKLSAMG